MNTLLNQLNTDGASPTLSCASIYTQSSYEHQLNTNGALDTCTKAAALLNTMGMRAYKSGSVSTSTMSNAIDSKVNALSVTIDNQLSSKASTAYVDTNKADIALNKRVVDAALTAKADLLVKTLSGSHAVALTCAVPESAAARAIVDETELQREADMRLSVATLQDAVDGSEIHGEGLDANTSFNITGDQFCVILIDDAGTKVGKCGCHVSQCQAGSLVADAMQRVTGADFAVINGGGIDASLPKGVITQENVRKMLPHLDEVVVLENVLGSTVREMLLNSISLLAAPDVTTNPHGGYLQVSKGLQFEWYFAGTQILLGAINICRQGSVDKMIGAGCGNSTDFEPLDDAGAYTIAAPRFIANGGDSYGMLTNESKVPVHKTQYEVVVEFLTEFNGGIPSMVSDVLQLHGAAPLTSKCDDAGGASTRVCQTRDVVLIPFGLYCKGDEASSLQECDQAHHMVSVINNKQDGFMDKLLPHARLVLHEKHVYTGCSKGLSRDASIRMNAEAAALTGVHGEKFVATIGPGCSNDVQDITGKQWRDESGNQNLVISGSSTSSTLSDDAAYPNLARMSTSEVGISAGFASLAAQYGWRRIAIVHDSSTWGTDSAKQFEARMLAGSSLENELIYLNFAGTVDRSQCSNYTETDLFGASKIANAKITNAKAGCDPITSFSVGKVRNGYPDDASGDCDPSDPSHFCVTEVIKQLKQVDAKIIFIAAQRDTQRALFREIYKNRGVLDADGNDYMNIYGEGYAYMSAWVGQDLFVDENGNIDNQALLGAMGTLGILDSVDTASDTFKSYTSLWGEVSSREACCQEGSTDGNVPYTCKRTSASNVTLPGQEHNFCDTDGDGTTGAGYSFSVADAVLALARALQHDDVYHKVPKNSSKLYTDLLKYHSESTDEQVSGVTGNIRFEPDSGDRNGDLRIVSLKTITTGAGTDGDSGAGRRRNRRVVERRVVELEKSFVDFVTIGYLRVRQGSTTRVLLNTEDCEGRECDLGAIFPGGSALAPVDDADHVPGPKLTDAQKRTIAGGVLAGIVVLAALIIFASCQWSRQHQIAFERRVANVYMLAGQPVPLKSGRKKSKAMMPADIVSDSEAAAVSASDSVITDAGIAFPIPQKDPKELTAAVFEAIHFDLFETIPFLLACGASASTRDAEMQLPLTRLLAAAAERADVESGLVQPSKQYLQRTFRSSRVRGTTEATRTQQIRIATYHLVAQHCEFDRMLSMILQRPAPKLMMEDAVQCMAKEAWTSDDGLEDTVAHRLLNACRERSLSEDLTMELVEAVLEINPAILTVANIKGVTPSDIAVRCDEMPHIQQRFTVVLFEHFQLLRPNQPMYKSATAEIHECSDLRLVHEASPNTASAAGSGLGGGVAGGDATAHPERIVMKLMADPDLWRRELYIRDHLKDQGDGNCIKITSAALVDAGNGSARTPVQTIDSIGDASPHLEHGRRGSDVSVASRKRRLSQLIAQAVSNKSVNPALQYAADHGTPERPITIVPQALVNTNRRAEARNLMKQFPYAIIMPLADRNLDEIISSERLAEEPLDTIRHTALKILTAVSSLHQKGVVHGDLKPTNIVRVNRDLYLLDLDMAFIKDSEDIAGNTNLEKLRDSTAYGAPELHRWIPALDERNRVDAVRSGSNMSSGRTSPSLTPSSNAGGGDSSVGGGLSRNDVLNDCTNGMPALSPTSPIDCFKAPEQMDLWSFAVSEIKSIPVILTSTLDVGSMCTCQCA